MYLGIGLYTPGDVAALLHERPGTVRRWAFGDRRRQRAGRVTHPPLIHTELPELEGRRALTFVELIELLYIHALRRAGVSQQEISDAATRAGRTFSTMHPFALRQLYARPESLRGSAGERARTDGIRRILDAYREQIEFGEDGVATRWWPMGRGGGVVLDPNRAFGAPTVEGTRIRAELLADSHDAELPEFGARAVERVAWTYEIDPRHVRNALEFREWLRRAP